MARSIGVPHRRSVVLIAVVLLVTTAGCSVGSIVGTEGEAGDEESAALIDYVPTDTEAVIAVNGSLLSDRETATVGDALLASDEDTEEWTTESLVAVLSSFYGVDHTEFDGAVVYADGPAVGTGAETGVLVGGGWSPDTIVTALERVDEQPYEETTHAGHSVYRRPVGTDPLHVGVIQNGSYAIGSESAVSAALDVAAGEADPAPASLRKAHESGHDGLVTGAVLVPGERLEQTTGGELAFVDRQALRDLESVAAAYRTPDGSVVVDGRMTFANASSAERGGEVLRGFTSLASLSVDDEALGRELERVNVSVRGAAVTVSYETQVDVIVDGIRRQATSSGSGADRADRDR